MTRSQIQLGNVEANEATAAASKPLYHRKWVGVLVSFLVPGAAQFLSGRRRLGLLWLSALWALSVVGDWCLAAAWTPGVVPGAVVLGVGLVLWIVMLIRSWLPIPRVRAGGWVCLVAFSGALTLVAGIVSRQISHPFYMPTSSMVPTILGEHLGEGGVTNRGDSVMADRTAYWFAQPQVGDLVVFRTKGIDGLPQDQFFVKRVVGVPCDELSIRDGHLLNHGDPVDCPETVARLNFVEEQWRAPLLSEGSAPFVVPSDTVFVVGDNTGNSNDSRHYGPIPARNVIGRVTKIYWPPSRAGTVN